MRARYAALVVACLAMLASGPAAAQNDDFEEKPWLEGETVLPPFPQDADLVEIYVSAATANRFFVDGRNVSPGSDGVVRYALVVKTSGGATNVSFEGMRCHTRELKLYATGRPDRTWSASRADNWRRIERKAINRHHNELWHNYFCPGGAAILSAAEGRDALLRGGHPKADGRRPD